MTIVKHIEKTDGKVTNITQNIKNIEPKEKKPKFIRKLNKYLNTKLSNKNIIRDSNKVVVEVDQPVYTKDKSRYFKTAWEEEKRQLFFK